MTGKSPASRLPAACALVNRFTKGGASPELGKGGPVRTGKAVDQGGTQGEQEFCKSTAIKATSSDADIAGHTLTTGPSGYEITTP